MNREFDTQRLLSAKLSRRDFLKLGVATLGIAVSQTACKPLEKMSARMIECFDSPRLEVPDSYIDDIRDIIYPLTKLMRPNLQNVSIKISKTRNNMYYSDIINGCALSKNNEIRILMPDSSPENLVLGKKTAFHEATHIYDFSYYQHPSKYVQQELKKRTGRRKYNTKELQILKESTYCNVDVCRKAGHPEDGHSEAFASSITILRFFPSKFIEKLEGVDSAESKLFLATNGRVCIDALKKFSAIPVEDSDLPFDPQLISYLTRESQK